MEEGRSKSPNRNKNNAFSPPQHASTKFPSDVQKNFGTISDLENKLLDAERLNKELQKEIKLLQRIQDRQGNALD